jgi:MFS family permease
MNKRILLSASIFHAFNDAATVTIPMVLPLLYSQTQLISSYSQIGILSYLGLLVTFVCQVIIVNYAYRFEYRNLLLFSILGTSLLLFMITFSAAFMKFLLFYLIMRGFMSFYHPIGIATVSRSHPDKGLDFAMGIQSGSGNLGVFITFIFMGYASQKFGWEAPLRLWALIGIGLGIAGYIVVRKVTTFRQEFQKPDLSKWAQTLKSIKNFVPGFIYGGACWGITVYYAPSLLHHKFQVPLGKTGLFLAAWIALGAFMPYLFGYLSRKVGRTNIVLFGIGFSTLFVLVLGLSSQKNLTILALLFFGTFLFLIYPAFQSFVAKHIPSPDQTVAFSLVANVLMISGAFGNLLAGLLSDKFGINYPFVFLSLLGAIVISFYLSQKYALPTE